MENETNNDTPATAPAPAAGTTPASGLAAHFQIVWNSQTFLGQAAINVIADRLERLEAGGGLSSNDVDSIRGLLRTFEERMKQLESLAGGTAGSIHQIIQTVNLQASDIARLSLQVQSMQPYQGAPIARPVVQHVPTQPAPAPIVEQPRCMSVCPLCRTAPGFFTENADEFNEHMRAGVHS